MTDDSVDHRGLGQERHDSHPPALMKAMSTARLPQRGQIIASTT